MSCGSRASRFPVERVVQMSRNDPAMLGLFTVLVCESLFGSGYLPPYNCAFTQKARLGI